MTNALLDQYLSGSDTAALGGGLAYQYGKTGALADVGLTAAQEILGDAHFGTGAQTLKPLSELQAGEEIVTYVARNLEPYLEPYRGFPSFMRSLPAIQQARPKTRILIIGGDEVSYGAAPRDDRTYRQRLLDELQGTLDLSRVHFLGKLPYRVYLKVLQISAVHVYLSYPFVLSWSMLEAMAAECLVVGSRTAPVEEVVRDGENGLLADFFQPEEIAQKVIAALEAPGDFAALRRNARQSVVEAYDPKRICLPGQLRLIEEAMSGHA